MSRRTPASKFLDRFRRAGDPDIVNEHVEPAERGDPLVDRLPHRVGIGGVSLVGV
jgi:hypothetical protein